MIEQYINNIYNEDCLEFMKQLPNKCIDMILCDLPYGTTACKWDIIIPFEPLWEQYKRIIKDNGAIVLTASQPFTSKLVMSNLGMFKYEWIWNKKRVTNILLSKKQPLKQHENILLFYKNQPIYNPQPTLKNTKGLMSNKNLKKSHKTETTGDSNLIQSDNENEYGYPKTILNDIPIMNNLSKDKSGLHPTQKPVALFSYLIETYTNENDIVLDNCSGSGTTAISCLETNRKYICCELDSNYYDISLKRIDDYNKQVKLF